MKLQAGADLSRLVCRVLADGCAERKHGGSPRLRIAFNAHGQRLLKGIHRSWGAHKDPSDTVFCGLTASFATNGFFPSFMPLAATLSIPASVFAPLRAPRLLDWEWSRGP